MIKDNTYTTYMWLLLALLVIFLGLSARAIILLLPSTSISESTSKKLKLLNFTLATQMFVQLFCILQSLISVTINVVAIHNKLYVLAQNAPELILEHSNSQTPLDWTGIC